MMGWGPGAVYGLCLLTSGLCAALLFRSYSRSRQPLLLWSALCFLLLAIANLLVVVPDGCDSATIESSGIHGVLTYPPLPTVGKAVAQAVPQPLAG